MTTTLPTDDRSATAAGIALAREAVRAFPWCFWFRSADAVVETGDDVRLVVRRLRQHGDRRAWDMAYRIEQCR
jgi:hypothetical protein